MKNLVPPFVLQRQTICHEFFEEHVEMFSALGVERCAQGPRASKEEVTLKSGDVSLEFRCKAGKKNR